MKRFSKRSIDDFLKKSLNILMEESKGISGVVSVEIFWLIPARVSTANLKENSRWILAELS